LNEESEVQQSNTNKTITVSFMLAGILAGIFIAVVCETIAAIATGPVGRFFAQDLVRHGLPVVVGFAVFVFLQANKGIHSWADEVVTEISRVVWPSRKDTTAMTVVVCVMVLLSGVLFGVLDAVSGAVVSWLLHQNFFGIFS
jgi:preprotein translocase subunit SecE